MIKPAVLPEIQQVNPVLPLQAYYAARDQKNKEAVAAKNMQAADMNMQMQQIKLNEYKQNEPQRQLEEKIKSLNNDKQVADFGKELMAKVDPDSKTFKQDIINAVGDFAELLESKGFTKDEAVGYVSYLGKMGAYTPENIKKTRVAMGIDKKSDVKQQYDQSTGQVVQYGVGEKPVAIDVENLGDARSKESAPTDMDDYVNDFKSQYKQDYGVEPPPGMVNDKRLEFKRAQAPETYAVNKAKGNAQADTAQRISYNDNIGKQLAIIDTSKALSDAKGEITPEEKKQRARVGVGNSLKTLAKHYLDLDSMGAIVNTEKSSIENISASAASSYLGQKVGSILGTEAQSIRNSINMIKPTLVQDIRAATEMGVRGMDSQKELEFYLQAATDEKRDIQANIAALYILDQKYGDGTLSEAFSGKVKDSDIKALSSEVKNIVENEQPPAGAAYGGKNPDTGEMEYFDKDGNKL